MCHANASTNSTKTSESRIINFLIQYIEKGFKVMNSDKVPSNIQKKTIKINNLSELTSEDVIKILETDPTFWDSTRALDKRMQEEGMTEEWLENFLKTTPKHVVDELNRRAFKKAVVMFDALMEEKKKNKNNANK